MKKLNSKLFVLVVLILSFLNSCKETTIIEPIPDTKGDCSKIDTSISDGIPQHLLGRLHPIKYPHCSSLQGTYLLFSEFTSEDIFLANKKTGERKLVDFQSMLPSNMKFVYFNNAVFCPYDDNLFMVHLTVKTDTIGNGQNFVTSNHLFVFNVLKGNLVLISSNFFGKIGLEFGLASWLKNSDVTNNNVYIAPFGIVNLETGNVIYNKISNNIMNMNVNGDVSVYGYYSLDQEGRDIWKYKLNDILLDFDPNFWTLIPEGLQFSQDGKYLMFTTKVVQMKPWVFDPFDPKGPEPDTIPYAQKRFLETFIVDVEKTKAAGKMVLHNIIRYRKDLCLTGVYYKAQFLTPRSYVISYRYNNTELHQLHEISIDGKILGQITR